jgi:hypothetical protein
MSKSGRFAAHPIERRSRRSPDERTGPMWKTLLVAGLMVATPAGAADYTLFIYESAADIAARTDAEKSSAYWGAYAAFADEATRAGVMRGGAGIEPVGATVGAAAPAWPTLGGYFVIAVPDLATARQWAAKLPAARTGRVDVRPHLPGMTGSR